MKKFILAICLMICLSFTVGCTAFTGAIEALEAAAASSNYYHEEELEGQGDDGGGDGGPGCGCD